VVKAKNTGHAYLLSRMKLSPLSFPAHVALSPDARWAYASVPRLGFRGRVHLAELLDPPAMTTGDLVLLGELVSARRIEASAESRLTTEQWLERWERFRRSRPGKAEDGRRKAE